ncbi:MAG: O-antigen ligase family protein [Verrucomicrobia bacterium]|nr:O-antigen ligase family protein [Verrucomicrobiota bacterium]
MSALAAVLVFASIVVMQLLFGGGEGTRFIYTLPAYVLLGVAGVVTLFAVRKSPGRMERGCLLWAGVLAAYFFARIALSPCAWLAAVDFYALLAGLLVYLITALVVRGTGARFAVALGLIVLGVVQSGIGIWQFARDPNFHPFVAGGREATSVRASGLFVSPNHLAGFLEIVLPLAVSLCFWGGFKARGRIVTGYLALVCLAGLVLTGSRGGYLSAGAGLVVFAGMSVWALRSRLSRSLLPRLVAVVVALALLGGAFAFAAARSYAIRSRANTVFVAEDVRLRLWEAAWKQFRLAPVFGTGSRTYLYYGRQFREPQDQADPIFAHSDWLQTLAEYGAAGFLIVVGFVAAHLRSGWHRWRTMVAHHFERVNSADESRAFALHAGALSAIVACLVHAALDFNLHIAANLLVTALLFGLLATRPTRAEEKPSWPARALHAVPAALGAWMLITGAPRLPGEWFVEKARGRFAVGEFQVALDAAGKARDHGAQNPHLSFLLGQWHRIRSKAVARYPAQRRAEIEKALEYYSEAHAMCPQDVVYVLRKAWMLSKLGRHDEAGPLFALAWDLDPYSPRVWFLSMLHAREIGDPAQALAYYRRLGGWLQPMQDEFQEKFDPIEMELLLLPDPPADPK